MTDISLETFEAEARDFLDANSVKKPAERKFVWGEGSDKVAMFEERNRTEPRMCCGQTMKVGRARSVQSGKTLRSRPLASASPTSASA